MISHKENIIFLSIIIPVYNVEKYLKQCLESILVCDLQNTEIILVNDGSTDTSGDICNDYAKEQSNIVLINQKNGGLSKARNTGIKVSHGKYVLFLDSDDFVIKDSLKECYEFILKSYKQDDKQGFDMIINDFYRCSENGKIFEETLQVPKQLDEDYLSEFVSTKGCYWNVWRVIYKKQFLLNNDLWFKEGYLCEDIDFTTRAFLCRGKMIFVHMPYYCYRMGRADSIMNVVSYYRVYSIVTIIEDLEVRLDDFANQQIADYAETTVRDRQYYSKQNLETISVAIKDRLSLEYIFSLTAIYEVAKEDKYKTVELFKDSIGILKYSHGTAAVFSRCISVFGIKPAAFGLLIIKRIRRVIRVCKIR